MSLRVKRRPWLPLALLSLFAVACAGDWSWQKRRRKLSFQVSKGSPLYEPARRAAEAWSKATGRHVQVSEDGDYPIFVSDSPDCWDGAEGTTGCSFLSSDETEGYIAVLPHVSPLDYYGVLLHEMGHHLRGLLQPEHLEDPSALMAEHRTVEAITAADVAFVCENFDCKGPRGASRGASRES